MAPQDTCCPPDSWPALKVDYKPKGKLIYIGRGLQAYVVGNGPRAVLALNDVFGIESGHSKEICDAIADHGFTVVFPDVFRGNHLKVSDMSKLFEELPGWAKQFDYESNLRQDVVEVILPYLHEKLGFKNNEKIALVGFCWGAFMLFHLAGDTKLPGGPFACGVSFHPSVQIEGVFQRDPLQLIDRATCPQLLLPSAGEPDFMKEEGDAIKKLRAKPFGASCGVKTFPNMQHGWVNRGDRSDPQVVRDAQQALQLAVDFMQRHTKANA
ncbi:hypothetical protein F1559_003471 [Cyanidiococcus yangmingshanensis]|uniref:Dienelactone hydrolase domain-containing protein n=1 Tax=Cyanidiococcus yangmingshanensis TaxID=2690220 RepID=A0A7J7IIK5_9RHOD|nr:hypothetical protein F1559_003471 [Cyanidiococcus yangmingshanensis]